MYVVIYSSVLNTPTRNIKHHPLNGRIYIIPFDLNTYYTAINTYTHTIVYPIHADVYYTRTYYNVRIYINVGFGQSKMHGYNIMCRVRYYRYNNLICYPSRMCPGTLLRRDCINNNNTRGMSTITETNNIVTNRLTSSTYTVLSVTR